MNTYQSDIHPTTELARRAPLGQGNVTTPQPLEPDLIPLLAENHDGFLRYLRSRLGSRDEAEDVLQDFYVKVLIKADQIKSRQTTRAWLYRVLKSVLIDYYRRRAVTRQVQQDLAAEPIETKATPAQDFDRTQCACFHKFIPTLKSEYAEVLRHVDLAGDSSKTAAVQIGTTPGNVRVRLHRARQALERSMRRSCDKCRTHECFGAPGSGVDANEAVTTH